MTKMLIISVFVAIIVLSGAVWIGMILWQGNEPTPPDMTPAPDSAETVSPQQFDKEWRDFQSQVQQENRQLDTQIRQLEQAL